MENLNSTLSEIRRNIKNWWILIVVGILFIGIGILVFAKPLASYVTLSVFFALGMLISGISQLWFAFANRKQIQGWGWQLTLGIMETVFGIVLIFKINITMSVLPFYVGFWLLFKSFALTAFSLEMKSLKILNWGYYLAFGILLGLLAWFIITNPLFGGLTIVSWTGMALIVAGIVHILLSIRLKKIKDNIPVLETQVFEQ